MTIREHLLLTLGSGVGQKDGQFNGIFGNVQSKRYDRVFGFLPPGYSKKNFYALLLQLERQKLVARSAMGGEPVVRITPEGITHLVWRYGHAGLLGKPWDGKWRIAVYDVPEKDRYTREKCRKLLGRFGFSSLHPSVYLSPFDTFERIRSEFAHENLLSSVFLMMADSSDLGDSRVLAGRLWPLSKIAEDYQHLIRRFQIVMGQQLPEKKHLGFRRVRSDFIRLVASDPLLPVELLPSGWPVGRIIAMVNDVKNIE